METNVIAIHGYLLLATEHEGQWEDYRETDIQSWFIEKNSNTARTILKTLEDSYPDESDIKSSIIESLFKKYSVLVNEYGDYCISLSLHKAVKVGNKVFREVDVTVEFPSVE